ncbi:MAG: transglutaminase-like domain-containing protein [Pseudomonadota bacterium]
MTRLIIGLVLVTLLAPGAAGAAEVSPTDAEIEAALAPMVGVRWYGVYMLGTKMGWVREDITLGDVEITQTWKAFFKLQVMFQEMKTEIDHAAVYRRGGGWAMLRASGTLVDRDRKVTASAEKVGEGFVVDVESRGAKSQVTWDWPPADARELVPWAGLARMNVGDTVAYHTVDVTEQERHGQTLEYKGERRTGTAKAGTRVFDLAIHDDRGMSIDMVLGESGLILEGGLGPSVRMVLEDEATAKSLSKSGLDLSLASHVSANRALDDEALERVVRLKVFLKGVKSEDLLEDARQTVREITDAGVVLEVRARALKDLAGGGPDWLDGRLTQLLPRLVGVKERRPPIPDPKWLECKPDTGCDHPEIRGMAKREAGERTGLELVLHLSKVVHKHMKYELGVSLDRAEEILLDGRGDCLEYATLLVALLRARGVPARAASGVAYAGSVPPTFGYHAWAEAWVDGHWVAVDPTWDEYPVDATHITFDHEDGFKMFQHFGALQIEIQDVEYAPPGL